MAERRLTDKQEKFVEGLIAGKSQREAYRAAYPRSVNWLDSTVDTQACILFKHPKVLERYNELHDRLIKEAEDECIVSAKDVLRELVNIISTDSNEIVELRRTCCRYCWGKKNKYQLTASEMARRKADYALEKEKAAEAGKKIKPFNFLGGVGYDATKEPNPKCPECFGEGEVTPFFHDTRKLSSAAKSLYAGVKVTKDGIEVKTQSKDKMIELLGKHLGMFKDKVEVSGNLNNPYESLTTEELKQLINSG
jgi:phage terminase small subunit